MTAMRSILGLSAICLAACQPTYNWRDVSFEGTRVKAQLPCKPDRTTREVTIGETPVPLQVAGCEAGGGMWVVMTTLLPAGQDPQKVLQGWQTATWRNLQNTAPPNQPWQAPQALPGAVRVSTQLTQADGQALQVQGVWAAFAQPDGTQWINAMVYHPNLPAVAADTFFESLRQP
jgi:hypothetical protein